MTVSVDSREVALTAAKDVFWRRGYDASIEELVQATGWNRYAIYSSFGGKRELFMAALDDYYHERKRLFVGGLFDPNIEPLKNVQRVFDFSVQEMAQRGNGCLLANIAAELGRYDAGIAARVRGYLDEIEWAYTQALQSSRMRGELNASVTPEGGARVLIATMLGLGVAARAGVPADQMLATVRDVIGALGVGPPPAAENTAPGSKLSACEPNC